jgi:uncharacterized protein (TIGR02596 family)
MINSQYHSRARTGFSLIELLVVLGIMISLAAISMTVFNSQGGGVQLTGAATQLKGSLDLARQRAMTLNQTVEVRFFFVDGYYRAYGTYGVESDGSVGAALDKVSQLPQGVVIAPDVAYSSLVDDQDTSLMVGKADVPALGTNLDYVGFRFRSSGGADLGTQTGNVTLVTEVKAQASGLPDNFATLTLSPVTGMIRVDRP